MQKHNDVIELRDGVARTGLAAHAERAANTHLLYGATERAAALGALPPKLDAATDRMVALLAGVKQMRQDRMAALDAPAPAAPAHARQHAPARRPGLRL